MELDLLWHICPVGDHQPIEFIPVVTARLEVKAYAEHSLRGVAAGTVSNDGLAVADNLVLIIRHINRISTGLYLIADRLLLEKVQREDEIRDFPALTEQSHLRIGELHKLFAAGSQVLKSDNRNQCWRKSMPWYSNRRL